MMTPSLNTAVRDVLQQGCIFLDRIGDEKYARPLESPVGGKPASLGAHYRHVLDHFLCLAEGICTGQVNYDQRHRNAQLESSLTCARLVTEGLIDEFAGLSREILQRECAVTYSVGYGETEAEAVAFVVCNAIGLGTGTASQDYVGLYGGDAKLLTESLEYVQQTASRILTAIAPENSATPA